MPTIEDRLRQWRQELLDFSNRNRLLNFRWSTTRPSSVQLIAPEAVSVFQDLLEGRALTVVGNDPPDIQDDGEDSAEDPESDIAELQLSDTRQYVQARAGTAVASLPSEKANRVLLRLLARARTSEQELGINTLFAVFGLLKWQETPGASTWLYAPLVMLPLTIEERTREGSFRVSSAGEDLEFNQTIAERLKRDFGLDIVVDIDEETNLASVFSAVRTAVSGRPGWEVLEHVHLGHFQFYKLRMYTDLAEHSDVAAAHDIVQALGSDLAMISGLPDSVPSEEDFDRLVRPEDSFTILDVDASQLRAVQAAVHGAHLVIQGPPGTGKSQTIANIIAESVANGRTVLFVSEKAAAIDVVHRRLAEHGLADFCLMLHSHKANKREIIAELGAQLDPEAVRPASTQEHLKLTRLQEQRQRLNSYAVSLHQPREPLGESIFWVHGELASLQEVPLLMVPGPNSALLSHSELDRLEGLLEQLSVQGAVLDEGPEHPWTGARLEPPTLADRQRIKELLAALVPLVVTMRETGAALAGDLGLRDPKTVEELMALQNVAGLIPHDGGLRSEWFQDQQFAGAATLVADAKMHAMAKREVHGRLLEAYEPGILEIEPEAAIAAYEQGFLSRLFSSSYKALRNRVHTLTKGAKKLSTDEHLAAFRDIEAYRQHEGWFEDNSSSLTDLLGLSPDKASSLSDTGWQMLGQRVALASQIRLALGQSNVPATFVKSVCEANIADRISGKLHQLRNAFDAYSQQMTALSAYFEDGAFPADLQGNLEALERLLTARAARLHELDRWIQAQRLLRKTEDAGLQTFVHALIDRKIPSHLWGMAYRRKALTDWLDLVVQSDPVMLEFSGEVHDRQIMQFRELDRDYIRNSNLRARRAHLAKNGPVTTAFGGEPEILRYEAAKRKRHMPLRRLFERIPNLLTTLKPCLMMSPLSVAQYLPADLYHFDLVIFDEASQVRPHDAIGAIMRGRQLIVAGDSKQLPPTSFFDRVTDDGLVDEDQDIRALESILDALDVKGMAAMRLLWHYRSRHEELIAYSNHHFYDNRLITFPSPAAGRSPSRGVRLEFVSGGIYQDERDRVLRTPIKVNRLEAKHVAQLVVQHARSRPHETLGVVTLGMNQRDVVEEEVKQALSLQRDLDDFFQQDKPEPFFVKALEQVQGDERDVIMISIGYGKNTSGVLSHNFGPINQQGGERRLNVLATRARNQVLLVSSIRFTDIDPNRTQNVGPRLLRNYLEFAERGSSALHLNEVTVAGEYESPFEEQVGEALKRAGFTVHPQVGASRYRIDLAIVDPRYPDRYILGVECDGRTYHQSKTARDRDRLRQEILEQQGWAIHRIWSTEWMRHPDHELQRVVAHVQSLLDGSSPPTPTSDGNAGEFEPSVHESAPPTDEVQVEPRSNHDIAVPYQTFYFPYPGTDLLETPIARVAEAIIECVEVEGPIHQELLQRRIVTLWGYQRAGSRIAQHVSKATRFAIQYKRIWQQGEFLWPARAISIVPRGLAEDGALREIAQIPDEEIEQAIVAILERAFSLSLDELTFQVARLFGFQRTGREIRERIHAVVGSVAQPGNIQVTEDRVQLGRDTGSRHRTSEFTSQVSFIPYDHTTDWAAPTPE